MELRQLEYFLAVCQELHFTRAAEQLGIAQPSLSQQIRLLEHEIGTPLFDRIGKKTMLTEAGRTLQHHCYNVFHELAEARASISELQGLGRGTLKIGALLSVVNYLLSGAAIAFNQRYPKIELSVLGLRTGDIIQGIMKNELDMGIVYLPTAHEELVTVPLQQEELVFAVPAAFTFMEEMTGTDSVCLDWLERFPSVLLPESYHLRQFIDSKCRPLGFTPKPVIEMTTLESIVQMVAKGVGVTILPKTYLAQVSDANITVFPINQPSMVTEIGIVYRKNKHLCAATRVFMEQLLSTVAHQ
ncbi:LysR family transcriptional regulator [Paenibacillus tuaregi]|uniref:LysR family transcriptional regulator n=1 Tax=Paenibacillus tuaregi TaxID=1816681 RepID=UPI000838A960|nr:LysR family transcriptional regulator [Paenibacillus tuaregi]